MKSNAQPWLQCVDLHPDVLSDDFSEDIFALDLGTLSDYLIGKELGRPEAELRRGESGGGDLLPPGIGEPDLLGASIGPDLDTTTIQACLKELKEQCLYLHFDGVRYCFKKDPNVTLLVEQEAEAVGRDEGRVRERVRQMIDQRLAGQRAIVWPEKSGDVPDREPEFLIAYLPIEFAAKSASDQRRAALTICEQHGSRRREFRNGLGLAVPSADQVEILRRAVRHLLAIERVKGKWREHNLTDAQRKQLREREATETAAAESALLKLYGEVWLPVSGDRSLELDAVRLGGRPLQTTLDEKKRALIQQRLMELLTIVHRRVFGTLAPGRIVELFKLGEDGPAHHGIATDTVLAGFFEFIGFPRLLTAEAVRKAIARGVETGLFGYATGRPQLGDHARYELDRSRVAFERSVADDEIDLDSGFLITPSAIPEKPAAPNDGATGKEDAGAGSENSQNNSGAGGGTEPADKPAHPYPTGRREIAFSFITDQRSLYQAWNAMANFADVAGKVAINAKATAPDGYDKAKVENGVLEPLRELGLIEDDEISK